MRSLVIGLLSYCAESWALKSECQILKRFVPCIIFRDHKKELTRAKDNVSCHSDAKRGISLVSLEGAPFKSILNVQSKIVVD